MEMKAKVSCSYEDENIAETISSSIQPDNLDSPEGVEVKTQKRGKEVKSEIKVEGEIETLLATLDDLLSCTSTAEKII